jgi:predicted membrane channel-forming protein YqfA (hemolysin III family)
MSSRLNGWQRLWVVLSALWLALVCAFTALVWSSQGGSASVLLYAFLGWVLPSALLYLLGLSAAWIIRGFRRANQ